MTIRRQSKRHKRVDVKMTTVPAMYDAHSNKEINKRNISIKMSLGLSAKTKQNKKNSAWIGV